MNNLTDFITLTFPIADKEILASMRKRNDDLAVQSKPLEKLVISVEGKIILPPEQTIYGHTITPHSERLYGGYSPKYDAGQSVTTEFRMINRTITGGTSYQQLDIIFEGPTALELENFVKVHLLLRENKKYENSGRIIPLSSGDRTISLEEGEEDVTPSVWVLRTIEKTEKALRIIKYTRKGGVVAAVYTDMEYAKELGFDVSKIPKC